MIPILMYHQIDIPPAKGAYLRGASVHPKRFENQMKWLHRFGYRGVSMKELLPYLRGEKQGKVVGLTFDDGYVNVFQNALPVLQKLGFSATNYIVSGELSGANYWAQPSGAIHADLMTAEQVRCWHEAGCEVGSHTVNHVYMDQVDTVEAMKQLTDSKAALEALIQAEVESFCYPYGAENLEVRKLAQQAGYSNATATFTGLANASDDMYALPRISIIRSTHPLRFLQKCFTTLEEKKRQKRLQTQA